MPTFKPTYKTSVILAAIIMAAVLCLAYSYFIEPDRLIIRHEELAIKGWNPAFDGLRIAMIGDVHGGSRGGEPDAIRRMVAATNAEHPDVIVMLGDYVSQNGKPWEGEFAHIKMPMDEIADSIQGLSAPYGVYAVLGNHDGWYGDKTVAGELSRVGYKVLQNEMVTIDRNGNHLRILGMIDHMKAGNHKEFSDKAKAVVAPTDGMGDLIVLEHSPDVLPWITGDLAISNDLKLMLCAHTHGGQVWLPVVGRPMIPSSWGQKYAYGHVFDRGIDMWVTSGLGTSMLPFRFMVPPEIVVLTVRTAN